ncbi:MAG: hypothetical protein ACJ76J_24420 [Thermoanaerobaculia bacterium]
MQNASFRRNVFLLLLLAVLAAPWASAAAGLDADRPAEAAASPLDLLGRFWTFLRSAWSETGCHLDPDGRCAPAPQPQSDTGCHLDPNGGCGA